MLIMLVCTAQLSTTWSFAIYITNKVTDISLHLLDVGPLRVSPVVRLSGD